MNDLPTPELEELLISAILTHDKLPLSLSARAELREQIILMHIAFARRLDITMKLKGGESR